MKPTEPGIYRDIPNDEYHAGKGLSSSGIKKMLDSPLHYWAAYLSPERVKEQKDCFDFGTAYHTYVLEPDKFSQTIAVIPEGIDRRTKAGKAAWEAFQSESAGKVCIKQPDMAAIEGMAAAVTSHPTASKIFHSGEAETSFYWIDEETGVLCKCRPDYYRKGLMIADLKSSQNASPSAFSRDCAKYGYHISAAFYLDGLAAHGDDLEGNFTFVVQEKTYPYAVACYVIADEAIALGRSQYKKALRTFSECQDSGLWPGYEENITYIDVPKWAYYQDED